MIDKKDLITIRPGKNADVAFIYATWSKSLYYHQPYYTQTDRKSFMDAYKVIIGYLLNKPSINVKVVCLKDDENVILAYAVMDVINQQNVIHYTFTKKMWRGIGLWKDLIQGCELSVCTHMTVIGEKIKPKEMKFNPFIL